MPPKPITPIYQEVRPNDPLVVDVPMLNKSASKWTKADLRLLGVDYQFRAFEDIPLGFEKVDMPLELLESRYPIHS